MVHSTDLAEIRLAFAYDMEQALGLLAKLEARLVEEEDAFSAWADEECRRDAERDAREAAEDADTVLNEAKGGAS